MFHRDTRHCAIHQRNICDKWFSREACFDLGDVKEENGIAVFWRNDLKFNAAWCFSGAHATGRFTKETFVTSSCRVKRVLHLGVVKVEKDTVTFIEEEDEDSLVEEGP